MTMEGETQFQLRPDKLIEAVIYLSERSADDPNFSVIKLVNLLYYADCAAYLKHGAPITGATYLHFPHGPYPEHWYKVRRQMQAAGDVEVLYEDSYDGHHRYRLLPNRAVKPEVLTDEDCAILDEQRERFAPFNTAGLSEHSHYQFSWLATEDGEPIPYVTAGVTDPPFSANEIKKLRQEMQEERRAVNDNAQQTASVPRSGDGAV